MAKVESTRGKAAHRKPAEYHSGEESVRLKGFAEPINYHEIVWSETPFGVRSSVVTRIVQEEKEPQRSVEHPLRPPVSPREWMLGRVVNWNEDAGRGFIRADGEEADRFVLKHWLVSGESLSPGMRIAFLPRPAQKDRKNDVAVCVVSIDVPIQAKAVVVPAERNYMFLEVSDANRTPNTGTIYCVKPAQPAAIGDWFSVLPAVDRSGRLALRIANPD